MIFCRMVNVRHRKRPCKYVDPVGEGRYHGPSVLVLQATATWFIFWFRHLELPSGYLTKTQTSSGLMDSTIKGIFLSLGVVAWVRAAYAVGHSMCQDREMLWNLTRTAQVRLPTCTAQVAEAFQDCQAEGAERGPRGDSRIRRLRTS